MPSGDSISKFDSSFDMFTARHCPIQQRKTQEIQQKKSMKVDSIETAKQMRSRLNPIRVLPRGAGIPADRAVKIARAGRYVFFVIAMPPFLLFYAIPKWVAVTLVPPMLAELEKGFENAKKLFKQVLKFFTEGMPNPFRNLFRRIQWQTKGVEKLNSGLLTYINKGFQRTAETFAKLVKLARLTVAAPMTKVIEKFLELSRDASRVFDDFASKVSEQGREIYQSTVEPVVNWMIPKVQVVQRSLELGIKWGRENVERLMREIIKPALKAVSDTGTAIKTWAVNTINPVLNQIVQVVQPMINLCIPTFRFLKKHLSFGIGWLKHKPKEFLWNMHKKTQKFIKSVLPFLDGSLEKSSEKFDAMVKWLSGPFITILAKYFPFIPWLLRKFVAFLKFVKKMLITGWGIVMNISQRIYRRFYRQLKPVKTGVVGSYDFAITQAKEMLKAPVAYFVELLHKGMRLILKTLKFCVLVVIGIGLVFKFWFEMLFELSDEVGSWGNSSKD